VTDIARAWASIDGKVTEFDTMAEEGMYGYYTFIVRRIITVSATKVTAPSLPAKKKYG
jgi:hypothetical protein